MKAAAETRSHKRLLKDINKAAIRRDDLLQRGKLSLPSGAGRLAIIVSRTADNRSELTPQQQHKAFLEEAERLGDERAAEHQQVGIRPIAVAGDMKMDFADPEVTDLILIGHGSISCLWADGDVKFDWRTAARAASVLKQGKIEQRMCGTFPRDDKIKPSATALSEGSRRYSVPLGTFAVSDLTSVIAAPGVAVPEAYPDDHLFRPIFTSQQAIEQIEILNQRHRGEPTLEIA